VTLRNLIVPLCLLKHGRGYHVLGNLELELDDLDLFCSVSAFFSGSVKRESNPSHILNKLSTFAETFDVPLQRAVGFFEPGTFLLGFV
jgi:hypothetical protein